MYRKKLFKLPLTKKVVGEEEHVRYIRCTYTFLKRVYLPMKTSKILLTTDLN